VTGAFRRRSVSGVAHIMLGRLFQAIVTFGTMAALARLLTPKDFGIVASVSAIVSFLGIFRDAGLVVAAIRARELSHQQSSNLFWFTLASSCVVALIIAALAPLAASVYRIPELTSLMIALGAAGIVEALGMQHGALLRRELQMRRYATATVASEAIAAASAIVLAVQGFGYWALAAKSIIAGASCSAMFWMFSAFRPGWPRRSSGMRELISFGLNMTLSQVLWTALRKADDALIGWAWGPSVLGYYSRAYSLLLLPTQQLISPLTSAVIPTLSRLQDQPERFRRYYLRGLEFIVLIGFPLVLLLFVAAEDVVLLVFGAQWLPSVPIFRALGPATLVEMTGAATWWVYVPLGRSDRELKLAAIYVPLYIGAVLCGLSAGAYWVAVAISVMRVVAQPLSVWYCYRGTVLVLRDYGAAIIRPFIASSASAALSWVLMSFVFSDVEPGPLRFVLYAALLGIMYLPLFALLPGGKSTLSELLQTFREMRAGPTSTTAEAADSSPA
jgi:O-antigen/teichoic acid export membrane protein